MSETPMTPDQPADDSSSTVAACMQEQQRLITTLHARITELEARPSRAAALRKAAHVSYWWESGCQSCAVEVEVAQELRRMADAAERDDAGKDTCEVEQLRADLAAAQALAADATEYEVHLPDAGGTTLRVRREQELTGNGWSVSIPRYGGGRAWTTEGWQDVISAITVQRLFCWPDAATAIAEARHALAAERGDA